MMVFPPLTTGTAADDNSCTPTHPILRLRTYGASGSTYEVPLGGTASTHIS